MIIIKKTICFVSPEAYPVLAGKDYSSSGGAEVQQVLLGRALCRLGLRVVFIVNDYGQEPQENYDGIAVIRCRFRYFGGSKVFFPIDTIGLIRTLAQVKAHVYLLKTPCSLLFAMGLYRRLFESRLVKLIAHDNECVTQPRGLASVLYLLGIKSLDCTVFQSQHQQDLGGRSLGLKGEIIKNIAHGTSAVTTKDKDFEVLWVGTCNPHKQPEVLFELAQALPDVSFVMIIAPGRDREYDEVIKERACSIPNIHYKGFVQYQDIGQCYSRAKVLVQTSSAEGFPNVFLQAWQYALPVVSLSIDPDAVIASNRLGFVSGSVSRLVKDVATLLNNEDLRQEMGRNGQKYLALNHGSEVIAKKYLEMIDRILAHA